MDKWRASRAAVPTPFWPSQRGLQLERHYACFMPVCGIPLKRLMPGSLSQRRTRYPPAGCSDFVNEFISSVAMARSAPPRSDEQPVSLCRVGVSCGSRGRRRRNSFSVNSQQRCIMVGKSVPPGIRGVTTAAIKTKSSPAGNSWCPFLGGKLDHFFFHLQGIRVTLFGNLRRAIIADVGQPNCCCLVPGRRRPRDS